MIINLDFAHDDMTFDQALAETLDVAGSPDVTTTIVGTANGWPVVAVEGAPDALVAFLRAYDDDPTLTTEDLAEYV